MHCLWYIQALRCRESDGRCRLDRVEPGPGGHRRQQWASLSPGLRSLLPLVAACWMLRCVLHQCCLTWITLLRSQANTFIGGQESSDTSAVCTSGCQLVIRVTVANTAAQQPTATQMSNFLNGYSANAIQGLSLFTNIQAVIIIPTGGSCHHWCNEYTCGKDECGGCRVCAGVEARQHCSWWCNVYTCDVFGGYCSGCSICDSLSARTHCEPWCSFYTCWVRGGFCDGCLSCGGTPVTTTPWATPFSTA